MQKRAQQRRLAMNDLMVVLAMFPVRRLILLRRRLVQQRVVRGSYTRGKNGCLLYWLSEGRIASREQRIRFSRQPGWAECTSRIVDSWDGRFDAPYALDTELVLSVVQAEVRRRVRRLARVRVATRQVFYKPGVIRQVSA